MGKLVFWRWAPKGPKRIIHQFTDKSLRYWNINTKVSREKLLEIIVNHIPEGQEKGQFQVWLYAGPMPNRNEPFERLLEVELDKPQVERLRQHFRKAHRKG